MVMTYIWAVMVVLSLIFGAINGTAAQVSTSAMEGAAAAVELCVSLLGALCLWSGIMEIMRLCGFSHFLARLFRPLLRRLFPQASRDEETLFALSANISANLLGLGNAATPMGIRAAEGMAKNCRGIASHELCRLVVLNTASIQFLPTTVAAIRASCGAASPFDILLAVWFSSVLALSCGLLACLIFKRLGRNALE
ncbi:MAG: spore maturation protein A [Oscillospiraceae bacterium]|nr:spore maturation protein A [Oscillospiraceae bacterium]